MAVERPSGRMRGNYRSLGRGNGVPKGLIGDVGDIDHHAQPVHLSDHLLAKFSEAVVVLDLFVVDVPRGVAPFVGVRPGQRHVAHAQPVIIAQDSQIVLDGVAALDAHQGGELAGLARLQDVIHAVRHAHAARVPARAFSRSRWPSATEVTLARSNFSSSKRWVVSAWVSTMIAEACMACASGLILTPELLPCALWALSPAVKQNSDTVNKTSFRIWLCRFPHLTLEQINKRLLHHRAPHFGDRTGERNVLGTNLHAILRITAL